MDVSPQFSELLPGLEDVAPRYLGNPSEFRHAAHFEPPIQWEPIEAIETVRKVKAVFISNIRSEVVPAFPSTAESSLEEIRFDGEISQLNFDQLVVPLVNLRYLDIHISSLQHLNFPNTLIQLNHLQCLEITCANFTYLHGIRADMCLVIDNAIALLRLQFPALTYLALCIPAVYEKEDAWTQALVDFLYRHRDSLKYVNLESPFPILEDSKGNQLRDPATAKNFEEELLSPGSLDSIALRSFHYFAMYRTSSTEFWRHFLLTQEHLEYCQFWCDSPLKALSPKVIRNNSRNLHTVAINNLNVSRGPDGTKLTINCSSFRECHNLSVLFLKGTAEPVCGPTIGPEIAESGDFENFHFMPSSLQKLKIMSVLMRVEETAWIVTNLRNLSSLHLERIGEQGGLGLEFEGLHQLVERRGIERLEVVCGLNRKSLETRPSDGSYKSMAKILFKRQLGGSWFRGNRNEIGVWEMLHLDLDMEEEDEDESESDVSSHHEHEEEPSEADLVGQAYGTPLSKLPYHHQHVTSDLVELQTIMFKGDPEERARRRRAKKVQESIASSDFHEIQSIVERLVDADEANVAEFLQ